MPKIKMYDKPNMAADVTISGLKMLKAPEKWSFIVNVEFDDKVFKQVEKDAVLLQEMKEVAQKVYKQTCETVKSKYKAFEALFQGMIDKGAKKDAVDAQMAGFNKSLEGDRDVGEKAAQQLVMSVWTKYAAKKQEYNKYKIKIFVTIAGAVAALAVSIGLMASAPFTGGASAAVSIIVLFRSAVTIAKEIGSAAAEIETSQKALEAYLKEVGKVAKKIPKANEYTAAVVKQFLGEAQPHIKSCGSQLETINAKLTGLEVKMHDCSVKLNEILDAQQKLSADFKKEAAARLSKHPGKDAPGQLNLISSRLDAYLQNNVKSVQQYIQKIAGLSTRLKEAQKTTEELEKQVKPLMALRGLDNTILENVLYFVDMPLGALTGNAMATASSDLVAGLVPVAASMAYDKITGAVLDKTLLVA
jgi:uncharacterized protein YhaN